MSKGLYVGDANKAKKIKSLFIGGGTARLTRLRRLILETKTTRLD